MEIFGFLFIPSVLLNVFLLAIFFRYKKSVVFHQKEKELYENALHHLKEDLERTKVENEITRGKCKKLSSLISHVSQSNLIGKGGFFEETLKTILEIFPEADYGYIAKIENTDWTFVACHGHNLEELNKYRYRREYFGNFPVPTVIENPQNTIPQKIPSFLKENFQKAFAPIARSLTMDLEIGGQVIGNLRIDIKKERTEEFSENSLQSFEDFANILSALITVQKYVIMQGRFQRDIVFSIIKILEIYDAYTKGHSEHVAQLSSKMGEALGLPPDDVRNLYWAGLVHDVGKILVPTVILNKPGKLTLQEYEMVKMHPIWGYQVLSTSEELKEIASIVKYHHEHWNGKGYPEHLAAEEIPLLSRIIALVDTYDSMTSNRAYRSGISSQEAKAKIMQLSGTQLDPKLVDTFLGIEL